MDDLREALRLLVTGVALITSRGRHGTNVMAAEWTFNVSYRPPRLVVLVHPSDATYDNIMDTREFGANFLSDEQATLASLAGNYTGKDTYKLGSELFQTFSARTIRPPMIAGCFLNAECRLAETFQTGDHVMFLGDVLHVQNDAAKRPLLYSQRRYWQRGPQLEKEQLIYVTMTPRVDRIKIEGRLQGVEQLPQTVSVSFGLENGEPIFNETVQTDERGYFEVQHPLEEQLGSARYKALASWNRLEGSAIGSLQETS